MRLLPYVKFYLEADAGGGGGAPAAEAMPSAADVVSELESFEPPTITIDDKTETEPKVDPKKEEKVEKKTDPKTEPKVDPKAKTTEPPAKQLREELERVKKEYADLKAQFENHPKVKELTEKLTERETAIQEREKRVADLEKELSIRDPAASEKLRELQTSFDGEYNRAIEMVPELEGQYASLVQEFARLDRTDRAKYAAGLNEFEEKLEGLVGQRKFGAAMDILQKGHKYMGEHAKMQQELRENAGRLSFEAKQKTWTGFTEQVSAGLKSALEVSEDLEKSDPFSPVIFANRALAEIPEEHRNELNKKIDSYITSVFAGPKPKIDKDFVGLTPAQIKERLAAEDQWHKDARDMAVKVMKRGLLVNTLIRPFLKEFAALKEKDEKRAAAAPPDPTAGGEHSSASDDDDIANFKAPPIPRL